MEKSSFIKSAVYDSQELLEILPSLIGLIKTTLTRLLVKNPLIALAVFCRIQTILNSILFVHG